MFKLPTFFKQEPERVLGIDVGTTAVKVLMLDQDEIARGSAYLDKYGFFGSSTYTLDLIKRGLSEAFNKADFEQRQSTRVLLSFPPDVFKSRVIEVNFNRQGGKIDDKEKAKLIEQVHIKAKEEICSELGILKSDFYFKEWELLNVNINGYSVPKLIGYDGKKVKIRFLVTFLFSRYLNLLEPIEDYVGEQVELIHLSQGLLRNLEQMEDGIYLDVGGSVTQVFLVKENKLRLASDFNQGGENFSQAIGEQLGLSELRSKVLKERYSEGELTSEVNEGIKQILLRTRTSWLRNLKETLSRSDPKILPSTFYLLGGGSKLPDIRIVLEKESWEDFSFLGKPRVRTFSRDKVGFSSLDLQYIPIALALS